MEAAPKPQTEQEKRNGEIWHTYLTTGAALKTMRLPWYEHPVFKPVFRALPADPRCQIIKAAQYHNVLTPDEPDGAFRQQVNPCPEATVPEGHGDAERLSCRIDATAACGDRATRWLRAIESTAQTRRSAVAPTAQRHSALACASFFCQKSSAAS